jgi:DNA ligase-associated metallophosphoesterase
MRSFWVHATQTDASWVARLAARHQPVIFVGMKAGVRAMVNGNELVLLPQKAVYWEAESTLLLADLHLGKINHFRRSGYPVPPRANDANTTQLIDLLNHFKPNRTLFLGDLFHSHYNQEWEVLGQVVKHFSACSFELILGNHDIMSEVQYQRHQLTVHNELRVGNLLLTHEPQEPQQAGCYNLAGHIHPGARLVGGAKQSLTLPCFYFGARQGILPAFGSFTGLYRVPVKRNDLVYVVADGEVVKVAG